MAATDGRLARGGHGAKRGAALLQEAGLAFPAVQADVQRLLLLATITPPLGLLLLLLSLRKAEREGSLTRWN